MNRLPDLPAGIWRHWKGPLYQVFGYGHDANSDELFASNTFGDLPAYPEGRIVVVYMSLQLDGAHMGPRLAVRSVDDWFAWVDPGDGRPVSEDVISDSQGSLNYIRRSGYVQRFTYEGPQLTRGMINDQRD